MLYYSVRSVHRMEINSVHKMEIRDDETDRSRRYTKDI